MDLVFACTDISKKLGFEDAEPSGWLSEITLDGFEGSEWLWMALNGSEWLGWEGVSPSTMLAAVCALRLAGTPLCTLCTKFGAMAG